MAIQEPTKRPSQWTVDQFETVKKFVRWLNEHEQTVTEAAARLGISVGTASPLLRGEYDHKVDRHVAEMAGIMRRARQRALAPKVPEYRTTSVTERTIEMLTIAHVERRIVLVLGGTGVGKTTGCLRYAASEPAIYLECGENASPRPLIKDLAVKCGIEPKGHVRELRGAIIEVLRGSDKLLICDEIDPVGEKALQNIRLIHDAAHVGVALVGTSAYLEKLHYCRSATVAQLIGRFAYVKYMDGCSPDDIRAIASQFDLEDEAVDVLVDGCGGQARRAALALCAVQRLNGPKVTAKIMRKALGELMPLMEGE